MDANKDFASIAVEIFLPDTALQNIYYQTFHNFTKQFEKLVGAEWVMEENFFTNDNKSVCMIYTELQHVNIFKETDWPVIIVFLKKNIIALDAFWNLYKPAFELLV